MMRPQFGSPPCQLVFTSGLFATARAAASASVNRLRAVHPHGHDTVNALAVAHNHFGEFQTDVIQRGLKSSVSNVEFEC